MTKKPENPHASTLFAQSISDQKAEADIEAAKKQANDMKSWTLMKRVQYLKVWLWRQGLKKTGENTYNKFKYFQLPDFLPLVNEKLFEMDIYSEFNITPAVYADGVEVEPEMAILSLQDVNGNGHVWVKAPTKENTMGSNPIQNEGGKHTYMHRYLWIDLLGLAEGDEIDQTSGMKQNAPKQEPTVKQEPMITEAQMDIIRTILSPEEINAVVKKKGLDTLDQMTLKQASGMITWAKGEKGIK